MIQVDPETGEELARYTIEFERGVSAYIPLDTAAADRLTAIKLHFFHIQTFVVGESMNIPLPSQLRRIGNKTIMLLTGMRLPEITDRPETLLFDWEDFEVAGTLDKLSETIAKRQRFEKDRENLSSKSNRKDIEAALGCSSRQASRVLQKLRGRKFVRTPLREQILSLLADGEKTPELTGAIKGHSKALNTKLTRMVNAGEIVKVKRGVY